MGKRRVHEIAKELGIESKDLIKKLHDIGVDVKSHSSTVDEDDLKRALAGPAPKKPDIKRAPGMMVRKKADIPLTPAKEDDHAEHHSASNEESAHDTHAAEHDHHQGEENEVLQAREPAHEPVVVPPSVFTPPEVHAPVVQVKHEQQAPVQDHSAAAVRTSPSQPTVSQPTAAQATATPPAAATEQSATTAHAGQAPESAQASTTTTTAAQPATGSQTSATTPPAQSAAPAQPTAPQQPATAAQPGQQAAPGTPPPAGQPPAHPATGKPLAPTTGARVVRMIDAATLVNRIPQRRGPGGPGGFRPGGPGGPGGFRPGGPGGPGGFRPGGAPGPGGFRPGGPRPGPGMLEPQMPNRFGPVREIKVVSDAFKGKEMVDVSGGKNAKKTGAKTTGDGRRERLDKRSLMQQDRNFGASRLRRRRGVKRKTESTTALTMKEAKRVVDMDETITVADLASQLSVKATDIIRKLMEMGTMATMNQALDVDTATLVAEAYGFRINDETFDEDEFLETDEEGADQNLLPRPPVVTVMGHVDHGKTSLLDAIRSADVASGEAGGITQHIGAYTVETPKGRIAFLDTPGHEAFTSMRARGADVTDLVILVVAADDGPMPQTVEAIRHAQAAKVPIIVAINKMDKPGAKPDQIMQSLTEYQLVPEEWGGDTVYVKTSAIKREGINELLENVLLQAEVLELKANPDRYARGTVIEARLDKGFGPRATVMVQDGTLKVGDWVVVGDTYGRVRAMQDSHGEDIDEAGPSTPVNIVGLAEVPSAGDAVNAVEDQDSAKQVAEHRAAEQKEKDLARRQPKVSLEDLYAKLKGGAGGGAKEFKIIVKADVQGSVEALSQAFRKLSTSEVTLSIVHAAVGAVNEGDVMLASTSGAVVIAFNVKPDGKTKAFAETEGVELKQYSIIYNALDDVRKAMGGLLAPTFKEQSVGRAEVRQVFNTPKLGTVAGCAVTDGKVIRNGRVRLTREGKAIFDGKLTGLKRFKDDAREVAQGFECGMVLESFTDIRVGDIIEAYEVLEIARTLDSPPPPSTRPTGGGRPQNANA